MSLPRPDRIVTLDLIRGAAVLGILAINIAGFAGPTGATLSPHIPAPGTFGDELVYAAGLVIFEGKMRALFTVLFGASMLLFIDHAEADGRDGDVLQLRRLGWLLVFGVLHFFLFWWGDILFSYGLVGVAALFMRELPVKAMIAAALLIFAGWHMGGAVANLPEVRSEERVRLGTATPTEARTHIAFERQIQANAAREMDEYRAGFVEQTAVKLDKRPLWLIEMTLPNVGETLPLMLIGMALFRTGFFTGGWPRRRMWQLAAIGTVGGLVITAALTDWLWQRQFPPRAMTSALLYWLALPHLLMSLGYLALFALASPWLAATALGKRLAATGRMAFSNYIGTTIVMTALFYGWGLGLIGTIGRVGQVAFVLLAWITMLTWSQPWLTYFRQGPLEWLWRSLTEMRAMPLRRNDIAIHSH